MASLAVSGMSRLRASDDELRADGPSYTADTLDRQQTRGFSASQIFFITGADAFADIATWMRYPAVLDLAHFVVVTRPGHRLEALADRLPDLAPRMRRAADATDAGAQTFIYLLEAATPDVSSTLIRDRLRRGERVTGLVPPLVETHIHQHGLYASVAPVSEDKADSADQLHGQN